MLELLNLLVWIVAVENSVDPGYPSASALYDWEAAGAPVKSPVGPSYPSTYLAIDGEGMFIVRDTVSNEVLLSRFGGFVFDNHGFLITRDGKRVQGKLRDEDALLQDIRIYVDPGDATQHSSYVPQSRTASAIKSFSIERGGLIVATFMSETTQSLGRILLARPAKTGTLKPRGGEVFLPSGGIEAYGVPGTEGWGSLRSGALEETNTLKIRTALVTDPKQMGEWMVATGAPLDLAIRGEGSFLVRDPNTDQQFLTRAGAFRKDVEGRIVTRTGLRLQGFAPRADHRLSDLAISSLHGPASLSEPIFPNSRVVEDFVFDRRGLLHIRLSDGSEIEGGQIALYKARDASPTQKQDSTLSIISSLEDLERVTGDSQIWCGSLNLAEFDETLLEWRRHQRNLFQGAVMLDRVPSHLATSGEGFFLLRDLKTGERVASRCGSFELDDDGHFVLNDRFRLQGQLSPSDTAISDLRVPRADPWSIQAGRNEPANYLVGVDGIIKVQTAEGQWTPVGQIVLQSFRDPNQLTIVASHIYDEVWPDRYSRWSSPSYLRLGRGDRVYGNLEAAAPQPAYPSLARRNGMGEIYQGATEHPTAPEMLWLQLPRPGLVVRVDPPLVPIAGSNNIAGSSFAVETSSDLRTWTQAGVPDYSDAYGGWIWQPPSAMNAPFQFFRIRPEVAVAPP